MDNQDKPRLFSYINKEGIMVVIPLIPLPREIFKLPREIFKLPRLILEEDYTIDDKCIYCIEGDVDCICNEKK